MQADNDRRNRALYLQRGDTRVESSGAFDASAERVHAPVTYGTVQAALLDFLIEEIGTNQVPDFPDWLRAQALILAQAAHEPDWLTVKTPVIGDDVTWSSDSLTTHTMRVASGSWDALSRETFDVLVRRYFGSEGHYPLRNAEARRLMGEAP